MQTASSSRLRIGAAVATGMLGLVFGFGGFAFAGQPDHTAKKDNGGTATTTDAAPGAADRSVESGGSGTQGASTSNPDGAPGVDKPYAADGYDANTQGDTVDSDGNNGCGNDADFSDDNNGNCGGLHKGQERGAAASPAAVGAAEEERCPKASTMGQQHGQGAGVTKHCDTPAPAPAAVSAESLSASAPPAPHALAAETVTAGATAPEAVSGTALASSIPASVLALEIERPAQVLGETIERGSAGGAAPGVGGAAVLGTTITRGALAFTGSATLLLTLIALTLIAIGVTAKRLSTRRA